MNSLRAMWIPLAFLLCSAAHAAEPAQPEGKLLVPDVPGIGDMIDLHARLVPSKARPGEVIQLIVEGTLKPDCYTYPMTEQSAKKAGGTVPKLKVEGKDFVILYPVEEQGKRSWHKTEGVEGIDWVFQDTFTWKVDLLVPPSAKQGTTPLRCAITMQVCKSGACLNGTFSTEASLEVEGSPVTPSGKAVTGSRTPPDVKMIDPPTTDVDPEKAAAGLWGFLVASGVAAFLMLLTPCVFPMIPITVSFFLKQAEKEHHSPLKTAVVYSLTIVVVLSLSVVLVGQLIVALANNEWLNLGLGAVLIFFALSLFGMYEIELPTFLSNWTSSKHGSSLAGTVFMALTFTITSFTCTGPFLGPLLVSAKELQISQTELILGAVTYSVVFAAPFFVLALFPSLIKKLPKSGGWLNNIKVVMGFLELAAALKFLANTDIALFPGNPRLFNYDTVLCAWMGLSFLCGLYLLGVFRLPHDSPVESLSVARMLLASLFFGLTVYLWPALDREKPLGSVGSAVTAFLPLDTRPKEEEFTYDLDEAWERAIREDKPIFIDFTGVNCTNCRANENNVFPQPKVKNEMKKFVIVRLYTDTVPDPDLSKDQASAQAKVNMELQKNTFGDISNPYYVVIKPDRTKKKAVEDGKIQGEPVMKAKGLISDPKDFVQRLKDAQKR